MPQADTTDTSSKADHEVHLATEAPPDHSKPGLLGFKDTHDSAIETGRSEGVPSSSLARKKKFKDLHVAIGNNRENYPGRGETHSMKACVTSCSNTSIALLKGEVESSSSANTEPLSSPKPLQSPNDKGVTNQDRNNARCQYAVPIGYSEEQGETSTSPVSSPLFKESFQSGSQTSFVDLCRTPNTSLRTTVSDHDEENQSSESSETSPLISGPPYELLGNNGMLRAPSTLLDYDGKVRAPAEDDGKKRRPCPLLGHDTRDGKKSHVPAGTQSKVTKRRPMKTEDGGPDSPNASKPASGSLFGGGKAKENDVFGPSATAQRKASTTSGVPSGSKYTRGSLQIEVRNFRPMIHLRFRNSLKLIRRWR